MKAILIQLSKLMSVRMLAIGLTFVQTIVMTRVFGSETFGLISFALSVSALCVLVLSLGLDQVLSRDIARMGMKRVARSKRWQHVWRLIRWGVIPIVLATTCLGAFIVYATPIAGVYRATLFAAFILLPAVLLRKYLEAISLGTKRVILSITGSQIIYPLLMIFGGGVVWWFGVPPDGKAVAWTYTIALTGSMFASAMLITGTLREIMEKHTAEDESDDALTESPGHRALLKSGVHFSLVSLGFVLSQHIDVLLTGLLVSPEEAALVRIASRVAELAGLMRAIIVLQYRPIISEAYGQNDTAAIDLHVAFMLKVFVVTGGAITLFVMAYAEYVLLVFGDEFVVGANALRIYILGVFVTLIAGPGDVVLSQTENEHQVSGGLLTAIGVQAALGIALIPLFGVMGCAMANLCSMATLAFLMRKRAKHACNVETSLLRFFVKRS